MNTSHPLGPLQPLAAFRQFIVYKAVPKGDGKTNKFPVATASGQNAAGKEFAPGDVVGAHEPIHHLDYETASTIAKQWGDPFGIGFVLTANDPFWVVDIDGCRTDTGWSQTALDVLKLLPGTVCEVSRSGKGLHIWGRGPIPEHRSRNTALHLELYSDLRFIALGDTAACKR